MAGELGFDTGPFVNIAAFCEPAGSTIQSTLLVMLKAGDARGPQTIQVVIEDPAGERREGPEQSVIFSPGPAGGVNLIFEANDPAFLHGFVLG